MITTAMSGAGAMITAVVHLERPACHDHDGDQGPEGRLGPLVGAARWQDGEGARGAVLGVAGPAGLAHIHADYGAVAGAAQRGSLFQVAGQCLTLVAGQQRSVGVDHPPPGHGAAPLRHDPAYLTWAAFAQVLGDIAVGHYPAGRNPLGDLKYPLGVVRQVGGHHWPCVGRVSPENGGPSAGPSGGSGLAGGRWPGGVPWPAEGPGAGQYPADGLDGASWPAGDSDSGS